MARIVLNTFGSFGDLHPYLAVAIGLKARGEQPVIATSEIYRAKVEGEGIEFAAVRPDVGELAGDGEFLEKLWDPKHGSEFLIREYLLPNVQASYQDLIDVCAQADLLLTHAAAYAGPLVAEKLKLPWLSVALQPLMFFSADSPPVLTPAPWLPFLRKFGRAPVQAVLALAHMHTRTWGRPIRQLRKAAGLPERKVDLMSDGMSSPYGALAWFSTVFADRQRDWPPKVRICGFPFYDKLTPETPKLQELEAFLRAGEPPVLFTLGSSAVMQAGSFYEESLAAANKLGIRAVLLVGQELARTFQSPSPNIFVAEYAPYSEVMPRCSAVVHQGGIGTTAQALRAGVPMIVVPWAHDQPDNAHRVEVLGAGSSIPRKHYTAASAAQALREIVRHAAEARKLGEAVRAEDGVGAACDAIRDAVSRARW